MDKGESGEAMDNGELTVDNDGDCNPVAVSGRLATASDSTGMVVGTVKPPAARADASVPLFTTGP